MLKKFSFPSLAYIFLYICIFLTAEEVIGAKSQDYSNVSNQALIPQLRNYKRWICVAMYTIFILSGESVATILGRLYYEKGGKSKWMGTFVQLAGFPILLPYYCIAKKKNPNPNPTTTTINSKPSILVLALVYIFFGLFVAGNCFLHSIGLSHLTVSTYSLICASQLSFSALFSFFLNSQKFTPYIVNSLALLTVSSILLAFQTDSAGNSQVFSKREYAVGFICTVTASAGYGLGLSLTQLAMQKIIKSETFSVVMNITIYQSLVAACAALVGLFVSGEWKGLKKEMNEFELGKISYIMTLGWAAILWQIFTIGAEGLVAEVSPLFSNVISVLSLPLVPIFSVIFLHDRMDRLKIMAMVLAIWGFISYVYHHYLDYCKSKAEKRNANG